LAAIAIPEQMATARLAGFAPQIGLLALMAGAVGFAIFGDSRRMSVGADSTIAPIFASTLAALAAGQAHYAAAAGALALLVGLALAIGGPLGLGFIADLLSIPVTTGFMAGIAVHIVVSQAPQILGLDPTAGSLVAKVGSLLSQIGFANGWTVGIGLGTLLIMIVSERLSSRFPAALVALALSGLATVALGLDAHGVATLGVVAGAAPHLSLPIVSYDDLRALTPLAALIALIVMMQTSATTRAFPDSANGPNVNRDFVGVGVSNILAGLTGAFPVDASPPRTAIVAETGGGSQLSGLICAAVALVVALFAGGLLAHVPYAALGGVLLFIALRIVRVGAMIDVWNRSRPEFLLILATILAIIVLPIEVGVGAGVILSLLHGVWTTTRGRAVELNRIPGTSIWWPASHSPKGEYVPGVRVVALQAPLSFLNAYSFRSAIDAFAGGAPVRLIVIEANALVEIDYTGASVFSDLVHALRQRSVDVAVARLESLRAQQSFERLGLLALIGPDHIFHSVQEAIDACGGSRAE
jgi:MFS superfamily sulfate permease-like transporter